jgi:hypothetical protein
VLARPDHAAELVTRRLEGCRRERWAGARPVAVRRRRPVTPGGAWGAARRRSGTGGGAVVQRDPATGRGGGDAG